MEWCCVYHIDNGGSWRRGVASTASTMVGLGGVAQLSLGDGSMWMYARRVVTLSGVTVVSTAVGSGKVNSLIPPKDETAEDGGGGL